MLLSEISNQGFRNLSPDPVSFGGGVTLITGENAQGKTNLLEAVAVVCGQRSFRGAAPADMAQDRERFSVAALVEGRAGADRLEISWSSAEGRRFQRGGKPAGFREVSTAAPAVFLGMEHRELLTGGPAGRRRFLDRLVLGLRPAGGDDLVRYATALRHRNSLLSSSRAGRASAAGEFEAWTEELCLAGSAVRRHRNAALASWAEIFGELTRTAGGDYAAIRAACTAADESPDALRADCQRLLSLERRRGYSLAGPHRDDLVFERRGLPLSAQASAGEISRTVALVKLAEWRALHRAAGEPPLFGADDFDAGLSEGWVEDFFDALPEGASVLLTTAAAPARWARRASAVLEVRGGGVSRVRALRAVEAAGV